MRRRAAWACFATAILGGAFLSGMRTNERITPAQAHALVEQGALLLDVRTHEEFAAHHAGGAVNIPVEDLGARLDELERSRHADIVLYCRSGRRSRIARDLLEAEGFTRVHDVGGLSDWESVKARAAAPRR